MGVDQKRNRLFGKIDIDPKLSCEFAVGYDALIEIYPSLEPVLRVVCELL